MSRHNETVRRKRMLDYPAESDQFGDSANLAKLCSASEPADEDQLERALHDARRKAKDQVRQQMGLASCRPTCSIATI